MSAHLVYHFYISVSPHVDPWNDRDIQFDICTVDCITLRAIHEVILQTLDIQKSTKLYYKKNKNIPSQDNNNTNHNGSSEIDHDLSLDLDKTLKELGIDPNSTIFLERLSTKRNRDEMAIVGNQSIVIYLLTRINNNKDPSTLRRFKILCREQDDFGDIMDELSDTLDRSGLKFKFGRSILKSGKSLQEQGLYDGCEVMIVGGRG
jgi:hypothetical protein